MTRVGSIPSGPIIDTYSETRFLLPNSESSSEVEHQIETLKDVGSNPTLTNVSRLYARRQVVWHMTFNHEGMGSNPIGRISSSFCEKKDGVKLS